MKRKFEIFIPIRRPARYWRGKVYAVISWWPDLWRHQLLSIAHLDYSRVYQDEGFCELELS